MNNTLVPCAPLSQPVDPQPETSSHNPDIQILRQEIRRSMQRAEQCETTINDCVHEVRATNDIKYDSLDSNYKTGEATTIVVLVLRHSRG